MLKYPVITFKANNIIIGVFFVDLEMIFPKHYFQNTSYFLFKFQIVTCNISEVVIKTYLFHNLFKYKIKCSTVLVKSINTYLNKFVSSPKCSIFKKKSCYTVSVRKITITKIHCFKFTSVRFSGKHNY